MDKKPLRIRYDVFLIDFEDGLECPCCGHNVIVGDGTDACSHLVFVWLYREGVFDYVKSEFAAKFTPIYEDYRARLKAAILALGDLMEAMDYETEIDPMAFELSRISNRELDEIDFLELLKTCGYEGNLDVYDATDCGIACGRVSSTVIIGFENDAIIGDESTITIP